jgi:hypothetical protein
MSITKSCQKHNGEGNDICLSVGTSGDPADVDKESLGMTPSPRRDFAPSSSLHRANELALNPAFFRRTNIQSPATHLERLLTRRKARTAVMPARTGKRTREDMDVEEAVESTLTRLRSMWQFANLSQYLSLFGDAIKIDKDFDIEVGPACAMRRREW